jgi:phage anti-repressor protein
MSSSNISKVYLPAISSDDVPLLAQFIHDNMDGDIQQAFVDSFMLHVCNGDDKFVVDGCAAQEWLGYSSKDNFKAFYTSHLTKGDDYEVLLQAKHHPTEDVRFTVDAVKRLGMLAQTEKGWNVREYYLQLEKLVSAWQLERISEKSREDAEKSRLVMEYQVSKALVEGRGILPVVYISKVKQLDDGWYIAKLGETDNLYDRGDSLETEYGYSRFMYVIDVLRAHEFEQWLLNENEVAKYKDYEHFQGKTDVLKINDSILESIVAFIKRSYLSFDSLDRKEELEMRRLIKESNNELEKERLKVTKEVNIRDSETRAKLAGAEVSRMQAIDRMNNQIEEEMRQLSMLADMVRASPREKCLLEMWKTQSANVEKTKAAILDHIGACKLNLVM